MLRNLRKWMGAFLLLGLSFNEALAWPPTYGAEFTFTSETILEAWRRDAAAGNPSFVNNEASEAARDQMEHELRKRCLRRQDCVIEILENSYGVKTVRVNYTDGWWFQIATDPAVVEMQTKPATREQLHSYRERISLDIFELAESIGIKPSPQGAGGGHIHIGMDSALDNDAIRFRNFVVDFVNHAEIASGIFANDHSNAPPIAMLSSEQRAAFARTIAAFDKKPSYTVRELAAEIQKNVYATTPSGWSPPQKYQALNIVRILNKTPKNERTMEIRSINPQLSPDDFLLEVTLWDKRLNMIKDSKGLVKLSDLDALNALIKGYDPLRVKDLARRFYFYVTEAGLSWNDYKKWAWGFSVADLDLNRNCNGSLEVMMRKPLKMNVGRDPLSVTAPTLPQASSKAKAPTQKKKVQ